MKTIYLIGDATNPTGSGIKIIGHIVNTSGKWGKGFVLAISNKWQHTREDYLKWYQADQAKLGEVQFIKVTQYITVANMVGQKGIKTGSSGPPVRYDAIEKCLNKLKHEAENLNASIHLPRIGCGLAGGKWDKIEALLDKVFKNSNITIRVYTLPNEINNYPKVDYVS